MRTAPVRGVALCACAVLGCSCVRLLSPIPQPSQDSSLPETSNTPLVTVDSFEVEWATTTHVMWHFSLSGLVGDLEALELHVAESEAEVLSGEGPTFRLDRYDRSSLGLADDASLSLVERSVSIWHEADTRYYGRLVAIDRRGERSVSPLVSVQTQVEPTNEIVVFADADTNGYSIPADFVLSDRAPFRGTHHYEWRVDCPEDPCYNILRRQELGIDLSAIDAVSFAKTAFVEFAVASESAYKSRSRLRIWFGTNDDQNEADLCELGYWDYGTDGKYRVQRLPLRELVCDAEGTQKVSYETISRGLYELGFDGSWSKGSLVRSDEWRIRW